MKKYVLAVDQGTTSSRAILFNKQGKIVKIVNQSLPIYFPKPGWVYQNPEEIWQTVVNCIKKLLKECNITFDNIDSLGITNQRNTALVWEKKTGKPVFSAISWQSRHTEDLCEARMKYADMVLNHTGLKISSYYSASKIRYILDHITNGQKRAERGELLFGNVDSWLIYKMSNGKKHVTDITNASCTLLLNIKKLAWDEQMLKLWNIPKAMMPKILPTAYHFCDMDYFKAKVPVTGLIGDQQSSLFGQTCFDKGDGKNTYGTGCFMLVNTGDKAIISKKGLATTVAWQFENKVTYALESSMFMGGAIIQWLRDGLEIIKSTPESESLANKVTDTAGVYLVPAFAGLGTPYWDCNARAALFGLTRGTTKEHIARAALESIALQNSDSIRTMQKETKIIVKNLDVDGGAVKNAYLMQFQSDILQCNVRVPTCIETTALGAAYMAGLYTGYYPNLKTLKHFHTYQAIYHHHMNKTLVKEKLDAWNLAVKCTRMFKPKHLI